MSPIMTLHSGNASGDAEIGTPTERLDRFLAEVRPPTPCIVLDLGIVRSRYAAFRLALPTAEIYYAVKANPAVEVVAALAKLGASFDLASPGEIDICLGLNVPPERPRYSGSACLFFDPAIAALAIAFLHCRPGDPESDLFLLSWPPVRVELPRGIESRAKYLLCVSRQASDPWRQILDNLIRH